MRILVTGAGGFLGREVVRLARERGHEVRAFVRRRDDPALGALDAASVFVGDMTRPESFGPAVDGVDAIIHCAATTSEGAPDLDLSRRTNVVGTANLIRAVEEHPRGAKPRWIQISSMSAHPTSTSVYGRTKYEADQVVRASGLPWTILRPSIIYGPGGKGLVSKTLAIMRNLPVVPVVGSGRELLRPVHVSDVARAALDCVQNSTTIHQSYMIGGADEISFNDFLRKLSESAGIRRALIHLPFPVALLIARTLGIISKNPPITVDNVLGIKQVQRVEIESAMRDFGFRPMGFDEGLNL